MRVKRILITALFATFASLCAAQADDIISVADTNASFAYGNQAFLQFIGENMRYPSLARANRIEGKVYISFVVDTNGYISDGKVLKDIGYGCGAEALRVAEFSTGLWKPAWHKGKKVKFRINFPIQFSLRSIPEPENPKIIVVQPPLTAYQYLMMGNREFESSHWKTAIRYYQMSHYSNFGDIDVLYNLGVAYVNDDQIDEACYVWWQSSSRDTGTYELMDQYCHCNQYLKIDFGYLEGVYLPGEVDTLATYPGGENAMQIFIRENLIYPETVKGIKLNVRQQVVFHVEKNGKINELIVLYPLYGFKHQAERIVEMFPKWKPAMKNGKPVRSQVCLEIEFRK